MDCIAYNLTSSAGGDSALALEIFKFLFFVLYGNKICLLSPVQTERSKPAGKRIMLETRVTVCPAFSVDLSGGMYRFVYETDDCLIFSLSRWRASHLERNGGLDFSLV